MVRRSLDELSDDEEVSATPAVRKTSDSCLVCRKVSPCYNQCINIHKRAELQDRPASASAASMRGSIARESKEKYWHFCDFMLTARYKCKFDEDKATRPSPQITRR
jgi:hypothetical protein